MMAAQDRATDGSVPLLDVDFFTEGLLRDPYQFYQRVRDLGPAVFVPKYGVYMVGRHADVQTVQKDWPNFTSTAGSGLSDIRKPGAWRPAGPIVETDPPNHTVVRTIMNRILSPIVVRGWREAFEREGAKIVGTAVEKGSFDGVREIAETFVFKVFPQALGLNISRDQAIIVGDMNFNALGPQNEMYHRSVAQVAPIQEWWQKSLTREALIPGGWGEQIFQAEDAGEVPQGTGSGLMMTLLRGGMDTTVSAIGSALWLLAKYQAQWQAFRANPSLARAVFEETIRFESPIQTYFRTTTKPIELSGAQLKADTKVQVLLGSANRDPRKWTDPDKFDIRRDTSGHVSLGTGIHNCVGQMIARLEGESVLKAFVDRVATLELEDEPRHRPNNSLRTLDNLRLRVTLN